MSDSEKPESAPAKSSKLAGVKELLGILSISRLLRWAIYFFIFSWIYVNWQENRPAAVLLEKHAFPDSKFMEIDGMNVHYRITGRGEPILLLHDEGSSLHTWTNWTAKLSGKYQIISLDLPGFGLTGQHPRGSYSSFMYAGFLDKFVDSLGLKSFNIAGNGLGAQIAWFFTAEHPAKVKKLILLNAPGFEKKSRGWLNLFARTPVLNQAILKITPRSFFKLSLEENFADDGLVSDSLINRHFDLFLFPGNRRAFIDRARVTENNPPVEFIEKITLPTLILWGAEDAVISPEFSYDFHKRIRKSEMKIYENTGHWPQEENPGESAEDVQAFLEGRF